MSPLDHPFSRIGRDDTGAVALMFAFALVVLIAAAGLAVDYGRLVALRTELQAAADAAVLAALAGPSPGGEGDQVNSESDMQSRAVAAFKGHLANGLGDLVSLDSLTVEVSDENGQKISRVGYAATAKLLFMPIVGLNATDITGSAVSRFEENVGEADIHILIDRSLTMGLPSDPNVWAPVDAKGCFFSCHDDGALARGLGVNIKIDTVASSIQALVNKLDTLTQTPGAITYSVYMFSDDFSIVKKDVGDASEIIDYFNSPITLTGSTDINIGLTGVTSAIMDRALSPAGKNRRQILVFASDGDHRRAASEYDPSLCDALKLAGVEIYSAHVYNSVTAYENPLAGRDLTYIDIEGGAKKGKYFVGLEQSDEVMAQCASSGDTFFSGEFGAQISENFDKIYTQMLRSDLALMK